MGYEACTTPPRNQCRNSGYNSNLGDGDFPYCSSGGFGGGFGGSGIYRPSGSISSSSGYRPGGSSSFGNRPGGSSVFRPSGGSSYNPPRNNRPSLSGILSGVRTVGSNSGSSSSSGSSDTGSSSGAISFDA